MFDSRLNIGNGTFSWQYDALNQMTGEKSMAGLTRLYEYQYAFDAAGNRTQMKYFDGTSTATTTYIHNDGNQLTQSSTGGPCRYFDYDDNGNMILESDEGGPVRSFDWNEDDRLIEVEKNSSTVQYTYDAMGRRIRRYDPDLDLVTLYYYEGLTVIAEKVSEDQGDYKWRRIFTVAPGVIGQILRISEKIDKEWESLYLHYDAIGNVALQTASDGSPVQPFDQEAYGNVRLGSQSGYHLTTKEYDSSADLYYFWQRWYDNEIGIFISTTKVYAFLEHKYNAFLNNPQKHIDVSGLYPTMIPDPTLGMPGDPFPSLPLMPEREYPHPILRNPYWPPGFPPFHGNNDANMCAGYICGSLGLTPEMTYACASIFEVIQWLSALPTEPNFTPSDMECWMRACEEAGENRYVD